MAESSWVDDSNAAQVHRNCRNVFHILAQRETTPRTKCLARKHWGEAFKSDVESYLEPKVERLKDARRELFSWVEAESLQHLSAKYCSLVPAPRSTIAAAFSPDGKTIASTHGDHTVKLIDCKTGNCLQVLNGHRRTPWVVRFHPLHPEVLASGSLDHEVRLWNANTSECIGSRDFYRPIASIAFHAEGELLAVASGHKLYLWNYNRSGEHSSPTIVLKTRRSLRAVHFHPHGAPLLLTAEVNDLDSSDSAVARPTSLGSLYYPPPSIFLANVHRSDSISLAAELPLMSSPSSYVPIIARDDSETDLQLGNPPVDSSSIQAEFSAPVQFEIDLNAIGHFDHRALPAETSTALHSNVQSTAADTLPSYNPSRVPNLVHDGSNNIADVQLGEANLSNVDPYGANSSAQPYTPQHAVESGFSVTRPIRVPADLRTQLLPSTNPTSWELPFLQGWIMGQRQAVMHPELPHVGRRQEGSSAYPRSHVEEDHHSRSSLNNGIGATSFSLISRIQSELAASISATAATELPCTVKLRIWLHSLKNPCSVLDNERCLLTIPHAVLCSEMGAHFSPCGRFLAACVACVLPESEADPGLLTQFYHNGTGAATSPTRHPISARQIMYELRIYSLEYATFGSVLVSRAIRAAHCLTSIQFSPTSEHILLAYGRRHSSLLKSIVVNGETSLPIYTVLEVYRVSDLEVVSMLPSAEDEVNVACFHPFAGGGLAYGTKEGRLRVLECDRVHDHQNLARPDIISPEDMVEVEQLF
ncbi:uncharacterized protein LOC108214942 [Daucus carota subsp. sativus]|uniref:uncharacterized protein LOC108214942 n=1 Tax=Daucus carota subsp. sativus TaxID=79200 RepID=UPI0007EFB1A5|nr:PREDICTED: uncharacterized protein LOC108214942 isoform X1 [Daucus carota subsp. sativus]